MMMMITAMILATGPWTGFQDLLQRRSHGMFEPAARAESAIQSADNQRSAMRYLSCLMSSPVGRSATVRPASNHRPVRFETRTWCRETRRRAWPRPAITAIGRRHGRSGRAAR